MHSRPGQFSLELLMVVAAYFALLSVFIAAENSAGKELSAAAKTLSNRTSASLTCLFLDFFSLNARNTAMRLGEQKNLLAAGHVLARGSERATCVAKMQGTEKKVRVEQNEREPA